MWCRLRGAGQPQFTAGALHARRLGISLVRGLGSRLPVHPVRAGRHAVREGPALVSALRAVPASQRPVARLRVGVQRLESARACLGCLAGLQHGETPAWPQRSGLAGAVLPQAAAEFHELGEQSRSRRPQRVRRGLSRPRQHQHLRSKRAARGRCLARAVRCDRLDGNVFPDDDADRPGTGEGESRLRELGLEVPAALRPHRLCDEAHGPPRLLPLRRRGWLLLRRATACRWAVSEIPGAFAGGADPDVRRRAAGGEVDRALQGVHCEPQLVREQPGRHGGEGHPACPARRRVDHAPADDHELRAAHAAVGPAARPGRVSVAAWRAVALQKARTRTVRV